MSKQMTRTGVKWLKHMRRTGGRKCSCGSWINHYERLSGNKRNRCCVFGCPNAATHGAHVRLSRSSSSSHKQWIALTCQECNPPGSVEEFRIVQNTRLVTANKCSYRRRRRK